MNFAFRFKNYFFLLSIMAGMVFLWPSCIHVHHDKFGKENNDERKILGLPIIKSSWRRDANIFYPAPHHTTLWFTNSRPKDISLPYHAYKRIYYLGDTLVAECDTYLNSNLKWFKSLAQANDSVDTLTKMYKNYHALEVTYVYKPLRTSEKDFSATAIGFNYKIIGVKDSFYDAQTLTSQQAELILQAWNLKRLNY